MRSKDIEKKILVLNGDNRNGLAIVRSLGQKGYICDITNSPSTPTIKFLKSLLKSKYIQRVHSLPILDNEQDFYSALLEILKHNKYSYLIGAGTEATNFISQHKKRLMPYVQPLAEDFNKMWLVHDKISCMKFAESIGITVPKTFQITSLASLKKATAEIDYPVIVKYSDSSASKGLWSYHCGGEKLLQEYIKRVPTIENQSQSDIYPLIQEKVYGELMDTTSFAIDGRTCAVLSQQRLMTAWLDGGGGLANITNDIPEIKKYTTLITQRLKWTGPIEIDWIVDLKNHKFTLIEINPKFWGTTQLTISAGLDYPYWLILNAEKRDVQTLSNYKIGLMGRWIFDELVAIFTIPNSKQRLKEELVLFFKRFRHKPCIYDIHITDIKPSIWEALYLCKKLFWRWVIFRQFWKIIR